VILFDIGGGSSELVAALGPALLARPQQGPPLLRIDAWESLMPDRRRSRLPERQAA